MGNSCARPPPRMTMILSWDDFAAWMLSGRKDRKRDFEVSFALEIEYLDGSVDDIEYYVRHHGLVNMLRLTLLNKNYLHLLLTHITMLVVVNISMYVFPIVNFCM